MIMQTFYVNHRIEFYLINTINPRVYCTHAMLYPQNGDHIVAMDSVTSLHPVYWHCYHTVRNMVYETVWLSVSPSHHLAAIPAAAASLLLCVRWAGDITCVLHGRCSAANVRRQVARWRRKLNTHLFRFHQLWMWTVLAYQYFDVRAKCNFR